MLSYLDAPQANQIRINQLPGNYEEVEFLPTYIPKSLNSIIMSYLDLEQAQKMNHAIETDQILGFGYTERIKK